ncbi:MAG TPA: hypothetical protein DEH78_14405 [Solibacterales bacterium]|nr:hypothetical protein [Bryobacterales bacterium]
MLVPSQIELTSHFPLPVDSGTAAAQVLALYRQLHQIVEEHRHVVAGLEGELRSFRHRLEQAESLATTDSLTGLRNRREGERLLRSRTEAGGSFSVALLDLNDFKEINDTWGHASGDAALQFFSQRLRGALLDSETACRWGGDEFLVIFPYGLAAAGVRVRKCVARVSGRYSLRRGVLVNVSTSVGLAEHRPGESVEQLLARADASLYGIKSTR